MSDTTRKEGQYWVLPKSTQVWTVWFWMPILGNGCWLHPITGKHKEFCSADLIAIDEKRLERTDMGADYYRPVFNEINSWISTLRDDPRKIGISLAEDGIRVGITLHISSNIRVQNVFMGTVQTFEELQTIWKCIPNKELQ